MYNNHKKKREHCQTWFLPGLLVSQLPEVIAATGVHRSIVQQEDSVSVSTPHVTHFLPIKEFTFSWRNHDLLINPTQAKLSVGSISPAQHRTSSLWLHTPAGSPSLLKNKKKQIEVCHLTSGRYTHISGCEMHSLQQATLSKVAKNRPDT